jgi:hypothetical protein
MRSPDGPVFTTVSLTVLSGLTTNTKSPWLPWRTALTGTVTTSCSVCTSIDTLTKAPGNRPLPALAKRALALTVPVVAST